MSTPRFTFPPLGPTGEGELQHEGRQGELFWQPGDDCFEARDRYYVTLQEDRPAVAFRCHEPGVSHPCDRATAEAFIDWVKQNV